MFEPNDKTELIELTGEDAKEFIEAVEEVIEYAEEHPDVFTVVHF